MTVVDTSDEKNDSERSLGVLDGVYSASDLSKAAFLIVGVKPNSERYYNQILSDLQGYLIHSRTTDGTPYALYLRDFTPEDLQIISSKLSISFAEHRKYNVLKVKSIFDLMSDTIVESAHAQSENCLVCSIQQLEVKSGSLNKIKSAVGTDAFLQTAYGCLIGSLKGLWNGSLGGVIDLVKGLFKFAASPIKSAKELWSGINQVWNFLKGFITDFNGTASKVYSGFSKLEPKVRGEMVCDAIATIGTAAAVTYFTAGAGSAKLSQAIENVLKKFSKAEKYASKLKVIREAKAAKKLANLPETTKIPVKDAQLAKKYAKDGYKPVALGPEYHRRAVPEIIRGKRVVATYSNKSGTNAGKIVEARGIVITQYSSGFDVLDAEGTIHEVNRHWVEIHDVFGKEGIKLTSLTMEEKGGEKTIDEITKSIENATKENGKVKKGPYVIADIPTGEALKTVTLTGELRVTKADGKTLYVITDKKGVQHIFNPEVVKEDYGLYSMRIRMIEGDSKIVKTINATPDIKEPIQILKSKDQIAEEAGKFKNQSASYDLFEKMRNEKGTYLSKKMGYLKEVPDQKGPILLLTPDKLKAIPDGTVVWDINGRRFVKGIDYLDDDTLGGFTCFGLRPTPEAGISN